MEKFSFFNDVDGDRVYYAEDFARHLSTYFTNGIFNNGCQVLADNDDMSVNVQIGSANINGYRYDNDAVKTLSVTNADGVLNRIDNVVIRWDLVNRTITTQIIQGTFAENAVAPDLVRNATIYDLRIAKINVPAGTTEITQDLVTDTRFITNDCGNVISTVQTPDTEQLFIQIQAIFDNTIADMNITFEEWFAKLKNELDSNQAGHLQNEINDINLSLDDFNDKFNGDSSIKKMVVEDGIRSKNFLNVDSLFTVTSAERSKIVTGIRLRAGTTYTLSCTDIDSSNPYDFLFYFNQGKTSQFAVYLSNGAKSITFTPEVDVTFVRIYSSNAWNSSANYTTTYKDLMIEEGDTPTEYSRHRDFDNTGYVLWANQDHTKDFASQIVSLNDEIENYIYYEIVYKLQTDSNVFFSTGKITVPFQTVMHVSESRNFRRAITALNQASITFSDAVYYNTWGNTATTTNNKFVIPYQILGYK